MEEREKRDLIECMSKVHEVTKNNALAIGEFANAARNASYAIGVFTIAVDRLRESIDKLTEGPDEGDDD